MIDTCMAKRFCKEDISKNKGKKFKKLSEETRRKISEAMKKYNAKKKGEI